MKILKYRKKNPNIHPAIYVDRHVNSSHLQTNMVNNFAATELRSPLSNFSAL